MLDPTTASRLQFALTTIVNVPAVAFGLVVVALTVVEGVAFLGLKTRGALRVEMGQYAKRITPAYLALVVVVIGYLALLYPNLRGALVSPLSLSLSLWSLSWRRSD